MSKEVTERDFRQPEFRDAKVEDYEFRADGKLVRKDRWEMAVQTIRGIVGLNAREFEIDEVIGAVRGLMDENGFEYQDSVEEAGDYDIILEDRSILRRATWQSEGERWVWRCLSIPNVIGWKECGK